MYDVLDNVSTIEILFYLIPFYTPIFYHYRSSGHGLLTSTAASYIESSNYIDVQPRAYTIFLIVC